MFDLRLRNYQGKIYVADDTGNIVMKGLRADQVTDIERYQRKRIKELASSSSNENVEKGNGNK